MIVGASALKIGGLKLVTGGRHESSRVLESLIERYR